MKHVLLFPILLFITVSIKADSLTSIFKKDSAQVLTAFEVVRNQKKNILTPQDNIANTWKNLPENFSFKYAFFSTMTQLEELEEFKFNKLNGDIQVFDYYRDGKKQDFQITHVNGYLLLFANNKVAIKLAWGHCDKFKIGRCEYVKNDKKVTYTNTYNNGIWTGTMSIEGSDYSKHHAVYDKMGLELYSWVNLENSSDSETLMEVNKRVN